MSPSSDDAPASSTPPIGMQGSAIVAVLGMSLLLGIVMSAVATAAVAGSAAGSAALHRERAFWAAESGLDEAILRLELGEGSPGDPGGNVWWPLVTWDEEVVADARVDVEIISGPREVPTFRIVATGRSSGAERAIEAIVRRRSVADYAWFTDIEAWDQVVTSTLRPRCTSYRYAFDAAPCARPVFGASDPIDGPIHTNDAVLLADRPTFTSVLSSAYATVDVTGRAVPALWDGTDPTGRTGPFGLSLRGPLALPERVDEIMRGVAPTCRFRGPTVIRFDGETARIRSPLSASTPAASDVATGLQQGPESFGCPGVPAAAFDVFASVALPDRAVIEVQDAGIMCEGHPLGLEDSDDADADWRCGAGDAFVWGRYTGSRAIVARGDIHLIWDLTRENVASDPSNVADRMGLTAEGSIVLRRLVGVPLPVVAPLGLNLAFAGSGVPPFGGYPLDAPNDTPLAWAAPRIDASLTALNGSVRIQNPLIGQRSAEPIRLTGSIAQRVRGPLGWDVLTTSGRLLARTGYELELTYDPSLILQAPPATPVFRGVEYRTIRRQEVPVPSHHTS
jgi:hypothetical protein